LEERLIVIIITTPDDFHYQANVLKVREKQGWLWSSSQEIMYFLFSEFFT